MRRGTWLVLSVGGAAVAAVVLACTGDDPPFIIAAGSDGGPNTPTPLADGSSGSTDGSSGDDAGPNPGSDSGAACGDRDPTPCGCGSAKSCCALDDGGALCQPRGNEDGNLGCTATNTISCVGNCGGGQACCFHGDVTAGETCPKRLTRFDSQCVTFDSADPGNACTDTSNGQRHHVMCQVNADCALYDAGTCQSAVMDTVGRVIGICAH